MKILWEGDVKPTHSERERKKFSFLLDYFADDDRYGSAKMLLHLVQNTVHGRCSTREEAQLLLNPLRQISIGILGRCESKLTESVQTFVYLISASFRKFNGLRASDNLSQNSRALRDFHICACKHSWCLALASWLNYQLTLRRIDKISVLGTKLSELVKECPDIFQLTDDATIISIPF